MIKCLLRKSTSSRVVVYPGGECPDVSESDVGVRDALGRVCARQDSVAYADAFREKVGSSLGAGDSDKEVEAALVLLTATRKWKQPRCC